MISQILQDAINKQINLELQSSYLYLAMSADCEGKNFKGFANWLKLQSHEEYGHALKLYDILNQLGATVELGAIPAPEARFDSFKQLFEKVYEHEQMVTRSINALYSLAVDEKAFAAQPGIQWFVTEQVEEENTAAGICHKFDLIQDNPVGLLALDRELGARTPAAGGE